MHNFKNDNYGNNYIPFHSLLFREKRNTKKGNKKELQIMEVTKYQKKVSDTKLVVINGSCVQLTAAGVTFPHQIISCKLYHPSGKGIIFSHQIISCNARGVV